MQVLNDNDYKTIEHLVKLSQPVLLNSLHSILQKYYTNITKTTDYLFAVGDIPIALVAHCDTVFTRQPDKVYYDMRQGVLWSPEGLGADDRAGVFLILKILKAGFKPHIIFTTDEEKGSLGAEKLIKAYPTPIADMKYIIQLDRHGTSDCVFYDCDNPEFTAYVEEFGFIEALGSFTDICTLCPAWKIAGVNLSVGYEDEHSVSETLHINPLFATLSKVKKMLAQADTAPAFEYIEDLSYKKYMKWYSGTDYPYHYHFDTIYCDRCHQSFYEEEMFPVKGAAGQTKWVCPDCMTTDISWCARCQEPFESLPGDSYKLCPDCRNGGNTTECKNNIQQSNNNLTKSSHTPKELPIQKQMNYSKNGKKQKKNS